VRWLAGPAWDNAAMAPRFFRRRRDDDDAAETAEGEERQGSLEDDDDHAWWAQRDLDTAWAPPPPPDEDDPAPPPADPLAVHFGDDWRTSFGFDAPPAPPLGGPELDVPPDDADPYVLLDVPPTAPWEQVVAAHRRMVRLHHPDRLADVSDVERAAGEAWIRAINAAYQELRVRRGR